MIAEIFWTKERFPGRLALVARPRGGDWLEDETASWAASGLEVIVSMLEPDETNAFDLNREEEFCRINGIEYISFPVPDRGTPIIGERLLNLVEGLKSQLRTGKNIGVHCRQSIGRSPLLAAAVMASLGRRPDDAFHELSLARGVTVPETREQKEWVDRFAEQFALALP